MTDAWEQKIKQAAVPRPEAEATTIECGEGETRYLLLLNEPGNLKQLLIEFLKWDGGEGSRAYDATKYYTLREALRKLTSVEPAVTWTGPGR